MNLPEEIRNKEFSIALRGYNISEVEDYIELLLEKYDTLYLFCSFVRIIKIYIVSSYRLSQSARDGWVKTYWILCSESASLTVDLAPTLSLTEEQEKDVF